MRTRGFFGKFATVAVTFTTGALALSGCAGGGADGASSSDSDAAASNGGEVKVGVAMPAQTSERWIADGNAVREGLETAGYEIDLQSTNDDTPTRTQQIDQMIINGATILVIASINDTAPSGQLDTAGSKDIPIIAYDRLTHDNEDVDFCISFDNFKVGVAQDNVLLYGLGLTDKGGKKLNNAPKDPPSTGLFAGLPDDSDAELFFDGAMSVLKPYLGDGTLVVRSGQTSFGQVAIPHWQQEVAQKCMEGLLASTYGGGSKPLAGVFSSFDSISRGIITALQGTGYGPTIKDNLPIVTSQDAEIAPIKMVNDGIQQSVIFRDTRILTAQAVTVVRAMAKGREPGANDTITYNSGVEVMPSYLLEVEVIYADNFKEKLIDFGYFTQADVDAGVIKK